MGRLAALTIETLTKPGRHGDGDGLYLNIASSGSKSWVQRIVVRGRRRDIGLGPYPAVSLPRARSVAQENRSAVAEGRDPVAEKREQREAARRQAPSIPTFAEATARVIELRRPTWSNPKHAAQWQSTLQTYAFPLIGNKAVDAISSAHAIEVLTPIWTSKPETASRVRQRIEIVMDWVVAQGYRLDNPAGRSLRKALPKTQLLKEYHKALPYAQVPGAVRRVRESTANISTKLAFEFLVLTASRSGEVRGADWSEVDLKSLVWEIPAARMKARRPHRVPLSTGAVTILLIVMELTGGQGLVFPARRTGRAASEMVFTNLLRRLGIPAVPHGFRTSFRNWAAECTPAPWAVAEAALAHNVGNSTEAAYMRSDLFDQRYTLMELWSAFVTDWTDAEVETDGRSPDIGTGAEAAHIWTDLSDQLRAQMDAQEAYVTEGTDTEGKTPEEIRDDFLLKILNDDIPGFPKFSDLPPLWRETPAESSYASYPVFPDRSTLLEIYIDMAKTQRWAWDGLHSLLSQMIENDELIPELLGTWGVYQLVKGGRPRKRGRPEEFDRDLRVWAVFEVLRSHRWTREAAMGHIAYLLGCRPEDTVLSIIRKLEKHFPLQ